MEGEEKRRGKKKRHVGKGVKEEIEKTVEGRREGSRLGYVNGKYLESDGKHSCM